MFPAWLAGDAVHSLRQGAPGEYRFEEEVHEFL